MSSNQFSLSIDEWAGKRCVYTTGKAFDDVVRALRASVARFPADVSKLWTELGNPTAEQFEALISEAVNLAEKPSGLFLFFDVDHGNWFRAFEPNAPKFHKFVIGNPIVLRNMVQHDLTAGLHAPWNFLLLELRDKDGSSVGTKVVFDLPSATMASKAGGEGLNEESRKLDAKFKETVESWL